MPSKRSFAEFLQVRNKISTFSYVLPAGSRLAYGANGSELHISGKDKTRFNSRGGGFEGALRSTSKNDNPHSRLTLCIQGSSNVGDT